ncbi:hypothetical protein M422DRAFT_263832 [Sphaerobolus stellatus SS14]|uniref:Unplaced genomic scaffold SPHSTscaffold_128, whole genome shotgun sequence n=1 Tax=Sphaerobolus stellatus (strain SS14) TaxID=990650 RepID=A0A0C9UXZ5_SPHS4|nr:hypothetical protein M422DRAFT_263832 [Sphaerobolus stellatus SS14]
MRLTIQYHPPSSGIELKLTSISHFPTLLSLGCDTIRIPSLKSSYYLSSRVYVSSCHWDLVVKMSHISFSTCHVDTIPTELIQDIFEYITEDIIDLSLWGLKSRSFYQPRLALVLSHVSSRWHSIARSNPKLWKEVHPLNHQLSTLCAELVSTNLQVSLFLTDRSQPDCPCCTKNKYTPNEANYKAAFAFIQQNAHRISKLFVFGSHALLDIFLTVPFPQLTTHILDLASNDDKLSNLRLFGGHAPKLQYAVWTSDRLPVLSCLPWRNLTTLHFIPGDARLTNREPNWTQWVSILSNNPHLEAISASISASGVLTNSISDRSIPLMFLQTASFSVKTILELKMLLQAVFIPQIRKVKIHIDRQEMTSMVDLVSALEMQESLLALMHQAEYCSVIAVDVPAIMSLYCCNSNNGTKIHIEASLLIHEQAGLFKLLPALKTLAVLHGWWLLGLKPMRSVKVLDLRYCEGFFCMYRRQYLSIPGDCLSSRKGLCRFGRPYTGSGALGQQFIKARVCHILGKGFNGGPLHHF